MKIGNITINGRTALAPMAGVADRAFRLLCKSFGASYTVGEMASAKGLSYGDRKSAALLALDPGEHPAAVQIFGSDPELMARCAAESLRYHPDVIDINMGCPAPKIVRSGGGSALMKNPALAGEIIRAVARSVDIPVTVKLRAGWDAEHVNCVQLARIAQESGAAALTLHGRTREQMYSGTCDLPVIRAVTEAVDIPVIGNGDVRDPESARRMLDETGCAMVMIGRGALGQPWIFGQIEAALRGDPIPPKPTAEERMAILLRHAAKMVEFKGERAAMREARKHAAWYFTGARGAAALRREAGTLTVYDDLKRLCEKALQALAE